MHIVIVPVADIKIDRAFRAVFQDIELIKMPEAAIYLLGFSLADGNSFYRQISLDYAADLFFYAVCRPIHIETGSKRLTEHRARHIIAEEDAHIGVNIAESH